jgi:hypothetical protein
VYLNYFDNIGYTLLTFLITYGVGHIIYGLTTQPGEFNVKTEFIKNTLGILTIILFYSLFKTHFITINVGFIIILFFYWFHNPLKVFSNFMINFRMVFIQVIILIVMYTFLYFWMFGFKNAPYIWLFIDHTIYASYIDKLNIIGAEGFLSDLFFKEPVRNIYHYGELWYAAFFTALFKGNTLQILYFSIFSNLLMVVYLGGKSILEHFFKKSEWYHWLFPFGIIFLSGIIFYFPISVPLFNTSWGNDTILSNIKLAPIAILFTWAFLCLIQKEYLNAVFILLLSIIFNIAVAPSLFLGLPLLLIILFKIKEVNFKQALSIIIPFITLFVFIILYALFIEILNKKYLTFDMNFEKDFILSDKIQNIKYYITLFNCTAGTVIKFFLSIAPFLILLSFSGYKILSEYKAIFIFTIILVFFSAFSYGIFHFDFNGTQFWTTPFIPLIAIFLFFVLAAANSNSQSVTTRLLTLIIAALIFYPYFFIKSAGMNFKQYTYSYHYLTENIPANHKEGIVVLYPKIKPTQIAGYDKNMYYPYSYIKLYINNYNPYCLSEFDTSLNEDINIRKYQINYLKRSVFYRYVERQKQQKLFSSIEQSQLDFIKEARVKYVLTQSGAALPRLIMPLVEKDIKDTLSPSSMDKLYILKDFK